MDGIMRVEDMATGDVKYAKFKDGKEGKEVSEKKFRKSCDKKLGKGGYEKFSEEMKKIEEMGNKRKKARQDTTHRITEQEQPVNSRKSNVLDAFKGIVGGVTSSASFQSGTPNLPNTKNPKTNKDKAR
jgi:hypothetical protein